MNKEQKKQALIVYVSRLTTLKKVGKNLLGCCPVHKEKTPSFYIYENSDKATCFGCGFKGDVFDLYIALNGGTFLDAKKNFGFWKNKAPKIPPKKPEYEIYSKARKKELYLSCREAIINGKKFTVKIKNNKLSAEMFLWLCLKDNKEKWGYIYQIIQECKKPIDGDLFFIWCDNQNYLFNYGSWGVEL